jgi:hypothetical protein
MMLVVLSSSWQADERFCTTDHATRSKRSDLPDVFTIRIDGTHIKPVTRNKNWDGSPDWGPP